MDWYLVIKTIKGHRYRYRQRTWRHGTRVRTRSEYLCPETIIGYHGTFAKFERFSSDYLASSNDCDGSREGFFFASNPRVAASYASTQIARRRGLEVRIETIERRIDSLAGGVGVYAAEYELRSGGKFDPDTANKLKHFLAMRERAMAKLSANAITKLTVSKRAEVKRCVLDLKNPYVHDMQGRRFDDSEFCEAAWHAQEGGHDGVIIRNTYDPGSCFLDCANERTNVYIVFSAEKINASAPQTAHKSAQPEAISAG